MAKISSTSVVGVGGSQKSGRMIETTSHYKIKVKSLVNWSWFFIFLLVIYHTPLGEAVRVHLALRNGYAAARTTPLLTCAPRLATHGNDRLLLFISGSGALTQPLRHVIPAQKRPLVAQRGRAILSATSNKIDAPVPISPPSENGNVESFPFEAEVSRVMDIIVNSLYTDKDVFLRELVSNAADACDKKKTLHEGAGPGSRIRIKADRDLKILTIEDSGIGMNRDDLIKNLGTIAHSGTSKFIQHLKDKKVDKNTLIGQFGVGFYSAFLVASKVEVTTSKEASGECWKWSSSCDGRYTLTRVPSPPEFLGGTRISLHLRDDCDEYLEDFKLKDLLRRYSEFIQFPIELWTEKVSYDRVPDETAPPGGKSSPLKMKTVTKKSHTWQVVNSEQPIWTRNKDKVPTADYINFYKTTFKAYDNPLKYVHFDVEGQVDFHCVLFIPGSLPWELSRSMFDDESRGVRLYVKRVFVNDKFSQSLPRWLTFLRGVVDSQSLPLNVGREILQKSRLLDIINKRISAAAIEMITSLKREGGEGWKKFSSVLGKYLKVGVVEDQTHRQDLAGLIDFYSTKSQAVRTSLDDYITRHSGKNKTIYYLSADSVAAAMKSPALEILLKKDLEVIFSTEPIDEFALASLAAEKYKGFELVDVNKADLKLLESESAEPTKQLEQSEIQNLCEWLLAVLRDKVQKVSVSDRLVSSPAVLVQGEYGLSPTMQRYMKQQAAMQQGNGKDSNMFGMNMNQAFLEINAQHPIIFQLAKLVARNKSSQVAKVFALQLLDVACLQSGYTIEDPHSFAKNVTYLMKEHAKHFAELEENNAIDEHKNNKQNLKPSPATGDELAPLEVEQNDREEDIAFQKLHDSRNISQALQTSPPTVESPTDCENNA